MIDVSQQWFQSGQAAHVDGIVLAPLPHPLLPNDPFMVKRGQAEAYYLSDDNGTEWILKKFLPGRSPDVQYIQAIQSLIPKKPGLESGYERCVLTASSISNAGYYTQDFVNWAENTILMRRVNGSGWAGLADKIRNGTHLLTQDERFLLCRKLSEKIRDLEQEGLSHRDLSSQNIFVALQDQEVHLIDWDSLYHSTLSMPANTTFGTEGYIAPFIKVNGQETPIVSWAPHSDRFSLALLNAEFLGMESGSPITGDGGAFEQDELYMRGGAGISNILDKVKINCPRAVRLIEQALNATSFDDCPSPDEWIAAARVQSVINLNVAASTQAPRFATLNRSNLVKLNRDKFAKAPGGSFAA